MAGIGNNLYPPIVDTYAPAFIYDQEDCKVYLNISQFNSESEIKKNLVQVIIQDQNTNRSVLNDSYVNEIKMATLNGNNQSGYYITISRNDIQENRFALNTYYKVQIRFTSSQASQFYSNNDGGFADWLNENLNYFSEWSSVVLIHGISKPTLNISELSNNSTTVLKRKHFEIIGSISFASAEDTEKLRKYWIELYHNSTLLEQSGEIISNNNQLLYNISSVLKESQNYTIKVQIQTTNFYSFSTPVSFSIRIADQSDIVGFQEIDVNIEQNNDKGCITLDILNKNYAPQQINPNLLLGTAMTPEDRLNWAIASSTDWTKYFRYYNGSTSIHTFTKMTGEEDIYEDTIKLNESANLGVSFARLATDISLDSNSYYTLSCEAKCNRSGASLSIFTTYLSTSNEWVWRGGQNAQSFTKTNTWQKFTYTFRPDANTLAINYGFTVSGINNSNYTFSIRKCKLEKGSVATPWVRETIQQNPEYIFDAGNFTLIGSTAYFNFTKQNIFSDYSFNVNKEVIKSYDPNEGKLTLRKDLNGLSIGMYILVKRMSSKDNFTKWENLGIAPIDRNNIQKIVWNDFTVQPGVFYRYVFLGYNSEDEWLGTYQKQGKYMLDSWDIFISDQDRQLKISLDPQISNFAIKTNEAVIETIGSQYPYIRRNNIINYKTFSLSGTISIFMDLGFNNFYASKRELYGDSYENYEIYNSNNNVSTYNDFIYEKFFRQEVIKFLQKNNVKLFRSLTQGNMLVKLSNITFTPNVTLGRKIYSFSCTVYEVANNSIDNINKYKIMETRRAINR